MPAAETGFVEPGALVVDGVVAGVLDVGAIRPDRAAVMDEAGRVAGRTGVVRVTAGEGAGRPFDLTLKTTTTTLNMTTTAPTMITAQRIGGFPVDRDEETRELAVSLAEPLGWDSGGYRRVGSGLILMSVGSASHFGVGSLRAADHLGTSVGWFALFTGSTVEIH